MLEAQLTAFGASPITSLTDLACTLAVLVRWPAALLIDITVLMLPIYLLCAVSTSAAVLRGRRGQGPGAVR